MSRFLTHVGDTTQSESRDFKSLFLPPTRCLQRVSKLFPATCTGNRFRKALKYAEQLESAGASKRFRVRGWWSPTLGAERFRAKGISEFPKEKKIDRLFVFLLNILSFVTHTHMEYHGIILNRFLSPAETCSAAGMQSALRSTDTAGGRGAECAATVGCCM